MEQWETHVRTITIVEVITILYALLTQMVLTEDLKDACK